MIYKKLSSLKTSLIFFPVYDPDPLMSSLSRRKRCQSWESGTSESSRAHKTPRASIDEAGPPKASSNGIVKNHHVQAGDLKMRIHVGLNGGNGLGGHHKKSSHVANGGCSGITSSAAASSGAGGQNFTTSKSVRKASLAQRPSISSVSFLIKIVFIDILTTVILKLE